MCWQSMRITVWQESHYCTHHKVLYCGGVVSEVAARFAGQDCYGLANKYYRKQEKKPEEDSDVISCMIAVVVEQVLSLST